MENSNDNSQSKAKFGFSEKSDLKRTIFKYLKYWKLFLASVIIFVVLAKLYTRYATPVFSSEASIRLLQEKSSTPEAALLGTSGMVSGMDKLIVDEIEIIKSRELQKEVVKELDYNISIYSQGKIKNIPLYPYYPIKVNFLVNDSILDNSSLEFTLKQITDETFVYVDEYGLESRQRFGTAIKTYIGDIIITPVPDYLDKYINSGTILFKLKPVWQVAESYKRKLLVSNENDRVNRSNLIKIKITDEVPQKAERYLNRLIEVYNQNSVQRKSDISQVTYKFINDRLELISSELDEVDKTIERFKVGNKLTNVTSEAGLFVEADAKNEEQLLSLGAQLNTVNYMINYLESQQEFSSIPANIGLSDPNISNISTKYNELILERSRLLRSSGEKNPIVVQLDSRLNGLKESLLSSLRNLKNTLNIQYNNLKSQEEILDARISNVPGQERQNRDIQRQQNIKEAIYLYLLQKREEAAIAMATTSPNAEVINYAYTDVKRPDSPKTMAILLSAFIFGLAIPFLYIYIKDLFDTKIHSKKDLKALIRGIPIIGQLPDMGKKESGKLNLNDRTVMAESFRSLRTNIDFLNGVPSHVGKVVYITSTINGEGKSFIAYNLAATYAYANKKVLLIGADIRKPNLNGYIKSKEKRGLSDFLSGHTTLHEVIKPVLSFDTFDVIQSGNIPPNPSELLMSKRMDELFEAVRAMYDVIIVDTAPTMLVTDTLLIGKFSDRTLYVTRAEYTDKELLQNVEEIYEENKLNGLCLMVNDVKSENFHYDNKYVYAYAADSKSRRWFRKNK
ncbi:GumC family protein [Robertkochia solimangrovi]|uniref:GumC family protein n=1 Tax=Robertkochia solimangrovi TaxID=2213046 RepID=UPI00117C605E|nr:tyrosine-protein kinase [Robertkochia solimangrovi]TRZ45028.1 tyrosine protein kinase [Robertkochia solimangrovi]